MGKVRFALFVAVIFKEGVFEGLSDRPFKQFSDQGSDRRAL